MPTFTSNTQLYLDQYDFGRWLPTPTHHSQARPSDSDCVALELHESPGILKARTFLSSAALDFMQTTLGSSLLGLF